MPATAAFLTIVTVQASALGIFHPAKNAYGLQGQYLFRKGGIDLLKVGYHSDYYE
jgi:hypothetical protein